MNCYKTNREIKFRAMCEVDGQESKMIYFLPQIFDNGVFAWPMPDNISHIDDYNSPLMQYTGMKSVDGIEIYEGDIVAHHDTMYGEVVFGNSSFGYIQRGPSNRDLNNGEFSPLLYKVKILGNIYENPELLK